MKHKIKKEYIKTNLIGFIIAGIIVSGVVVYAAVTFPSNEVSYSNTESGLNSNNVQGAIDELYETCTALTTGEQIIEDNGLEKDPYECRYFFTGSYPNNYITFNNETWRILSVECDGTIKIMREASIGESTWAISGWNTWTMPASLNTYLNETYLTSILSSTAQSQIVAKDWSIGGLAGDNMSEQVSNENNSKWNGKVALITSSEYIRSNSNQSNCGSFSLYAHNYESCKNTTWMFNSNYNWWTLTPNSFSTNFVVNVSPDGKIYSGRYTCGTGLDIRPAVYLSSDIKITGGDGSQSNPYQLSV